MLDPSYFNNVKGAMYFPARAYNAWQTWHDFDPEEFDRDFSYAEDAGINALRMFVSFEYWLEEPERFWEKFEQSVVISQKHGIRLMPALFEDCGADNTLERRTDRNPLTAVAVRSPETAIQQNPARWAEVHPFVEAFFARYANDSRLLAIEVMNEPNENSGNIPFAQHLLKLSRALSGSVPLTMGSMIMLHNLYYYDVNDLDILQYHDNFPPNPQVEATEMWEAKFVQDHYHKPCWLTEWQRTRVTGPGWDVPVIPQEDVPPALATLAPVVYGSGMGSFFWCLMLKPAYLMQQRMNGTFNGLFHEDGSVYSLEDYQAIAGKDKVRPEKKCAPEWYLESLKEWEEKK